MAAFRNFCWLAALLVLVTFHGLTAVHKVHAEDSSVSDGSSPTIEKTVGGVPPGSTTDTETAEREAESMSRSTEKFQFQAEVSRLMDIIINSLYSNKDIFLRELISNASDALDKIRFLSLTDKTQLGEGDASKLEIRIKLSDDKKVITIRDTGIGMTKEDLIKNLGTIAKSGTSAFLEKLQQGGDLNLIGQFGVGFYSVFLVADYVEVHSKHNDDKQWVWASKADGNFEIYEDTDAEDLLRGTEIRIHLKEEATEYTSVEKLRGLIKRYSEFINFPIHLWDSKEVEVEVPVDEVEEKEEDDEDDEKTTTDDEDEESDDDDDKKKKPKTKKVTETHWEWVVINDAKALWLRSPKDITEEEYNKFYMALDKDPQAQRPLTWSHFSAEGDVEFKSLLYIPRNTPEGFYDNYYSNKPGVKLYVRRVFISDEFEDLLPKFLMFLKGIVDSDTLPLNVSREMLQQHGSLKTIKKKLVRKALDLIRRLAEEDPAEKWEKEDEGDSEEEEGEKADASKKGQYKNFIKQYGKSLKLGVIEDSSNRNRIAKLLRFQTSQSGDRLVSLDEIISRMKDKQSHIYYLTGQSKDQLEKAPFLEKLLKKGYEVLYLTDPIDEYLMQHLTEYDDKKFQNASKDDLKIGDKKDKEKEKAVKEAFKPLTDWWKSSLGKDIEAVKVSNRLSETPCIVVTSKYGWTSNMERIMSAQALGDPSKQGYMKGRKTLEINPRHPIIQEMRERVDRDKEDPKLKSLATLIYETALLESGFELQDSKSYGEIVYDMVREHLDIDPAAKVEEDTEPEEEVSVEENDVHPSVGEEVFRERNKFMEEEAKKTQAMEEGTLSEDEDAIFGGDEGKDEL